jgi:hypothetical protein
MLAGHLALVVAAIFFGVAFYVSFVEQAARLGLDDRALLAEWKPAYKRGYVIQAPLAIVAFIMGIVACWQTGRPAFLVGALLMIANWPWTIFAVMPTNAVLMATSLDDANAGTPELIVRWNVLHSVRTILGGAATIAFLIALSSA